MRRKEELRLVRIEKTETDPKRNRKTVRVYEPKPAPWISTAVLQWGIVIAASIVIGVRLGRLF